MNHYPTTPPTERYFTLKPPLQRENFCVLLTRSELNIDEITTLLEQASGPLDERLAKVFGSKLILPADANLQMESNRLSFNADAAEQNVLPIVFYINTK